VYLAGNAPAGLPSAVFGRLVLNLAAIAVASQRADVHRLITALANLIIVEGCAGEAQPGLGFFELESSAGQRRALATQVIHDAEFLARGTEGVAVAQGPPGLFEGPIIK